MKRQATPGTILAVNGVPYCVESLLGHGKSGYAYLTRCQAAQLPSFAGNDGLFVVKQIHHEPCDYYTFGDKLQAELDAYARLHALALPMPKLLDTDAANERIVKQYIPGDTVFDMLCAGKETEVATLAVQLKACCRTLYATGLNIDYFPTNFIPWQGTLYYIDYECNAYDEKWDFEHWGAQYWCRSEAFLEYLSRHPKSADENI